MAGGCGAKTLYVKPGPPGGNGKLSVELLDREIFYTLTEVKVLTAQWDQVTVNFLPMIAINPVCDSMAPSAPAERSTGCCWSRLGRKDSGL